MTAKKETQAAPPKFEQAVADLEKIVDSMENGQMSLEDSLAAYQRGVALLRECQRQLAVAEERLAILEGESLRPFDVDSART